MTQELGRHAFYDELPKAAWHYEPRAEVIWRDGLLYQWHCGDGSFYHRGCWVKVPTYR